MTGIVFLLLKVVGSEFKRQLVSVFSLPLMSNPTIELRAFSTTKNEM
jgi:hypothetical protein